MADAAQPTVDKGGAFDGAIPLQRKSAGNAGVRPETVGQDLFRARQRIGQELNDVWRVLKIRPDYLSAIEDGRFDALPGRLYAIGYVRSYAAYLGLDADTVVERLKAEMAGREARESVVNPLPKAEVGGREAKEPLINLVPKAEIAGRDGPKEPVISLFPKTEIAGRGDVREHTIVPLLTAGATPRVDAKDRAIALSPEPEPRLPQVIVAGLMLVAALYTGYYVFSASGRTHPPVLPVPARLALDAGITAPAPVSAPAPAPVSAPTPAPAPVSATLPVAARAEQLATAILPAEPAAPATEIAVTPPVSVHVDLPPKREVALPPGQRYGLRNKNSRITLRAHRPTAILVQGGRNHTVFIDRALFPGDTYRVPNITGLRLTSPDPGAIELIVDGSSLGFAGEDRVTRSVLLNPRTIVGYLPGG